MEAECSPFLGQPGSPFLRALLDLGALHDKEVQALREQLKAASAAAEAVKGPVEDCVLPAEEAGEGRRESCSSWRQANSWESERRSSKLSVERRPSARPESRMEVMGSVLSMEQTARGGLPLKKSVSFTGGAVEGQEEEGESGEMRRSQYRWHSRSMYSGSKHNLAETLTTQTTQSSRLSSLHKSASRSRAFKLKLVACKAIVGLQAFDAICSLMIIGNSVLVGVTADWKVRNYFEASVPEDFKLYDRLFTCWFLLELLMRISGNGLEFFVHAKHWSWNLFDLCVVTADVANMLIDVSSPDEPASGGELLVVRLLRVLRITRALLIVRIFRFFRELRMMVFSVLRSGTSLAWSLVLFFLNLFLFSVFFTGQVAAYKHDGMAAGIAQELDSKLDELFGSMARAILTLFMSVTGGISWVEVSTPLHAVHWSNTLIFAFFIFFTLFALTNIITGIFVDTAIQSAQSDRDEIIQNQLHSRYSTLQQMQEILQEADADQDGAITLQELEDHLSNKRIRAHMEALGLQLEEARQLFKLLDGEKSGAVAVDEFIFGCMRLKGNARSIDLANLMYENKKMLTMLTSFFDYVETEFEKMGPLMSALTEGSSQGGSPRQLFLLSPPLSPRQTVSFGAEGIARESL